MTRFRPCRMLDWLYTAPLTKNVDGKLIIYRIGLASFIMANRSKNDQYFGDNLLPLIENQKLELKENHLIFKTNLQFYHQQWYQRPQQLEQQASVLVALSADCIQHQW